MKYSEPMKRLPLITHNLYAELVDLCRADVPDLDAWPLSGSVVMVPVDGQDHWYFQKSRRTSSGRYQERQYLGPAGDTKLAGRVESFEQAKQGYAIRAEIISTLKASGIAAPTGKLANILLGLHEAGVLRKSIVVGTVAFQAYGAMFGVKFGQSALYTMDVDITEARSIAFAPGPSQNFPTLLELLQGLDSGFREVPGLDPKTPPVSYMNKDRIRLDVLMPFSGPEPGLVRSSVLKSHGHPQRFLDYLVVDPVETVLLVGGGAPAFVPSPARFALHKLIVSQRRGSIEAAKRRKDLLQARQLLEIAIEDDPSFLASAYQDLAGRGPKWNRYFTKGLSALNDEDFVDKFKNAAGV